VLKRSLAISHERVPAGKAFFFTVLIVSLSAILQWLVWPYIKPAAFLLFYPAIVLVSFYGIPSLGLLFSASLVAAFFMTGEGFLNPADFARLATFTVSSIAMSVLVERVRKNQSKYRTLFMSITKEIHYWQVIIDKETKRVSSWKLIDANSAATDRWHREIGDIRGKRFEKIFGESLRQRYLERVQQLYETQRSFSFEEYARESDRFLNVTFIPLGKDFLVTVDDVTNIKKAHVLAQENEAHFRLVANTLPQLAWIANEQGEVYWVNDRWQAYVGRSLEEVVEEGGITALHDPASFSQLVKDWDQAIAKGESFEMTHTLRGRDGKSRWFLTRVAPLKDASGNVLRWFGTNTDINEQKRSMEELAQALQARDDFLSIASHELKTPLASLKLQAQITKRAIDREDPTALSKNRITSLVEQTDKQVDRLVRLVDDMLDVSRIRTGKLSLRPEKISLGDLVFEVLEKLRPAMNRIGIFPSLECEPNVELHCDKLRMEQVLMNLLTNAMKYGRQKPVYVQLIKTDRKSALLSVRDEGVGVLPESRERIFSRFERAISENEASGLGLGLFITRQIVEAHGGRIWVESEGFGKGSTFFVEIPIVMAREDAKAARNAGDIARA
jgi:PAS domain S-box-containing protein